MKKFALILTTLLVTFQISFFQRYVFYQDFNNNDNDWTVVTDEDYKISINNDKYHINNMAEGSLMEPH